MDDRDPFPGGHHRPDAHRSQPVPPSPRRRDGGRGRRRGPRPFFYSTSVGTLLVVGGSVAAVALSAPAPGRDARTASGTTESVVPAAADTYVVREMPGEGFGDEGKITASVWPEWHTEAYVAFDVPENTPAITQARIEFTFERSRNLPRQVELRRLAGSWTETDTSWSNRPAAGAVVATATTGDDRISFDVGSVVDRPGRYAFAITNESDSSAASVHSREAGGDGPRLVLTTRPGVSPVPSASPTRTTDTSGTALPQPAPEPAARAPRPTGSSGKPPGDGKTLCGISLNLKPGETFQEALSRLDGRYGGLETVRLFYRGVPPAWPGDPDLGKRPPIISFKLAPKDVLAGKHDEEMTHWFKTAPRDRDVYWVYYHEPEDNIANGEFTAEDYRAAWRHLRSLADKAGNERLHATLVLMSWSLTAESKRDWRDYYPGRSVIQVLGWDTYNLGWKKGRYDSPETMYGQVLEVSEKERLPFGIAETGSYLVGDDKGTERAAWLRATNAYLKKHGALWVSYFDLDWETGDFRLLDAPSHKAWQEFC
ncbi:DNRLRE domain-containing protein [Actinomadura sp. KC345]|uniref:CBM96 family carbohydrate-binding protein n=1 Tax=Actinomadura sp. KC345 TaxID=2530371 RepID=UPI00104EECEC|nr:DNRLRE domain-containing protein [Actinomadura sp. KC345]TDC55430.1 DNRLRE domain-containing protein [Actinomadura sp. KC345]